MDTRNGCGCDCAVKVVEAANTNPSVRKRAHAMAEKARSRGMISGSSPGPRFYSRWSALQPGTAHDQLVVSNSQSSRPHPFTHTGIFKPHTEIEQCSASDPQPLPSS